MTTPWVISQLLAWMVIGALTVLVLSLVRQLGVITIRLNPSAGLDMEEGPGPGSELPAQTVPLLRGGVFEFAGERKAPLLTVFLSPDCSICNAVAAYLVQVRRDYSATQLDILAVVYGTPKVVREYVASHDLEHVPVVLRQNFPNNHGITQTPFGLSLTRDGRVAARGIPNAMEHLEEMVERAIRLPDVVDDGRADADGDLVVSPPAGDAAPERTHAVAPTDHRVLPPNHSHTTEVSG